VTDANIVAMMLCLRRASAFDDVMSALNIRENVWRFDTL
jgi:hypothetical protein